MGRVGRWAVRRFTAEILIATEREMTLTRSASRQSSLFQSRRHLCTSVLQESTCVTARRSYWTRFFLLVVLDELSETPISCAKSRTDSLNCPCEFRPFPDIAVSIGGRGQPAIPARSVRRASRRQGGQLRRREFFRFRLDCKPFSHLSYQPMFSPSPNYQRSLNSTKRLSKNFLLSGRTRIHRDSFKRKERWTSSSTAGTQAFGTP